MKIRITRKMIQTALHEGYTIEEAERGYGIFQSFYGGGAEHIERLDCMMAYESDGEAAARAEKDGIKIIRDLKFKPEHQAWYVDTPENRKMLEPYVIQNRN